MSHEIVGSGAKLLYTMPAWPSDVLRSRQFTQFFEPHHGAPFSVRTRDGWTWFSSPTHEPAFTATFSSRETLDAVIDGSSEDALARAFLQGDLDIQGDVFTLLNVAEYVLRHSHGISHSLIRTLGHASIGWFKRLTSGSDTSVSRMGRLTNCPLDLPVSFFQSWLGDSLGHTCGHFGAANDTLEAAQARRLEQLCEAIQLRPDDCLLDTNCGWGNLLIHAAERGARAEGIAASEQQATIAAQRILQRGLRDRCHAACRSEPRGLDASFDKIVDVGIFDQIVHSHLSDFLARMRRLLVPGGLLLLHRMTRTRRLPRFASGSHLAEIASASDLTSLASELQCAEAMGLHTVSVEDLGDQYRRTLRLWIDHLQHNSHSCAACREYRDYRSWLLYLLDTVTNLETGTLQFHQILLSRPPESSDERPTAEPQN